MTVYKRAFLNTEANGLQQSKSTPGAALVSYKQESRATNEV